jgi:putative hemolysin
VLATALILTLLIGINAFYVAAEFSAVSVRHSRIQQMFTEGSRLARKLWPVLKDAKSLDTYIAACQIGITWSSLLLGAYAQASLTPRVAAAVQSFALMDPVVAISVAAAGVLVATTTLQVVFGELVPKSIALQYPTEAALYTVIPMRWSVVFYAPFLKILNGSGLAILRFIGFKATSHRHIHSPEELELLIGESRKGGMLDADEHRRLYRAIRLTTRPVRQVMSPISRVASINIDASEEELLEAVRAHRYTRYPVYRETLYQIVGMLHTADLVAFYVQKGRLPRVGDILRPLVTVGETDPAERLLTRFRESRSYQAVVTSEHGVAGVVTVGDLLAELLDDFEREQGSGQPEPQQLPDGRVRLPGRLRLDESAAWLGVQIPSGADTLGGALLQGFGRIPRAGERIRLAGIDTEVEVVKNNAIVSVLAQPQVPQSEETGG